MKGWSTDLGTKTEKTTQESVNKPGCSRQVFIQSLLQACSIRKPPTFATSLHGFFETKHGHPLKMHFFVNTHITETFVTLQNPENPLSVPCKIKTWPFLIGSTFNPICSHLLFFHKWLLSQNPEFQSLENNCNKQLPMLLRFGKECPILLLNCSKLHDRQHNSLVFSPYIKRINRKHNFDHLNFFNDYPKTKCCWKWKMLTLFTIVRTSLSFSWHKSFLIHNSNCWSKCLSVGIFRVDLTFGNK